MATQTSGAASEKRHEDVRDNGAKWLDRMKLPLPDPEFKDVKSYQDSKSDWPNVPMPSDGAPNIVVISGGMTG
jgi:hypothetical protein